MTPDRERVPARDRSILIGSMFGLFSHEGKVKLELVDGDVRQHILLSPAEAREQAMYMLEAAGAAERDAAFWIVAQDLGMDEDTAGRFLQACRQAHTRNDESP